MDCSNLCNFLCLLMVFTVVSSVYSTSCSLDVPCKGNRDRAPNGCCPTPPYEYCGGGGHGEGRCDQGLGYTCVETSPGEEGGTCQGPFQLRVLEENYTSLRIRWADVAPVNYSNEYIVLWTTDLNATEWDYDQFGREPTTVTLTRLEPDTLYFIRIGIWEDPERGEYRNLSEIAMAKTQAGCEFDRGRWLSVKEEHIVGCEERCVCSATGLNCTSLCPASISVSPGVSSNCSALSAGEEYPACCTQMVCTEGSCMAEDGSRYSNNEEYETTCEICVCANGVIECSPLFECENTDTTPCQGRKKKVSSDRDCCPQYECSSECVEGNVTYEHGDTVARGCNDDCRCHNGWIQCDTVCPEIELQPTRDCPHPVRKFPPGQRCARRYCRDTDNAECVIEGTPQSIGASHQTVQCRTCTCQDELSYHCNRSCYQDIEQIEATTSCPSPQFVRVDGECCPQIWCQNPRQETENTVRNLKVFWISRETLNVEFKVPNSEALDGPLLGYDVYYTENTETDTSVQWRSVFRSVDAPNTMSVSNTSSSSGPSNDSYRENSTVKMSISELTFGRTYLVHVQLRLDWERLQRSTLSGFQSSTSMSPDLIIPDQPRSALSITAVAPPITKFKCFVKGIYLQHGKQYQDGCDVICTCSYGETLCARVCPEDPTTCPRPIQTQPSDECCGRTKCYGKPGCCPYGNTTLSDGDIVREHCERYCRCDNGTIACWPVCSNLQPPNPGCKKLYHKERCCPTWRCPSEQQPPLAMSVTVTIKLAGMCEEQNPDFTDELLKSVFDKLTREGLCGIQPESDIVFPCSESQITVICPQFLASRLKRNTGHATILILVKIKAMNTGGAKNFTGEDQLTDVVGRLRNFTTKDIIVTVRNVSYPVLPGIDVSEVTIVCKPGYLKYSDGCMVGHVVSSNRSVSYHISLIADPVTENTAKLQWTGLPHVQLDYLDDIMLEYRDISSNDSWVSIHKLHVSTTAFVLQSLSAGTLYVVRLILLTTHPMVSRYTAASCVFQTHHIQGIPPHITRPKITEMEVSSTSVTVRWNKLSPEHRRFIQEVFIAYKEVPKTGAALPFKRSVALASFVTEYRVHALSPDTIYTMKVGLILSNKTTVFSLAADARTKMTTVTHDSQDLSTQRGVIIGVSVVAFVAVASLVVLLICIFRKGRGSSRLSNSSSETNFENKMFDMETQENTSFDKTSQ